MRDAAALALLLVACAPAPPPVSHAVTDVPIASASAQPTPAVDAGTARPPAPTIHTSEVVVLLDMSSSMRGIEEVPFGPRASDPRAPNAPTRFDVARSAALRLVEIAARRGMNDWVGVVAFGTDAYVLSPPTDDYAALVAFLRKTSIGLINPNGTQLGAAILKGLSLVDVPRVPREGDVRDDPTKNDTPRTLVVITDGNVGEAPEKYDVVTATRAAAVKGVRVNVVVIDDRDEVEVESGVDLFGKSVRTKMKFPTDRALLHLCANEGRGRFFVPSDSDSLDRELRWAFPL